MEKISVLMSTYREPQSWLKQAIDSIVQQTYKNIEFIILVDDPNNKELREVLNEYAQKYAFIKILVNEKNLGLVASLNNGLKFCTGKYIARMDADDIALPERLELEMRALLGKKYDIVGCRYKTFSEHGEGEISKDSVSSYVCRAMLKYKDCLAHPSWIAKKEVYDTLGGYRNIDACEDYDFLMRAALAGYKIANIKECLFRYRLNPNSISHAKNLQQDLTAILLQECYRNHKVISIEEYDRWKNSAAYTKDKEEYLALEAIKEKSHSKDFKEKIINTMKLFFISKWWHKRVDKFNQNMLYWLDDIIS